MFVIKTPNPEFNGIRNGITFVKDEARVEDEVLAFSFKEFGYSIKAVPKNTKPEVIKPKGEKNAAKKS